MHFAKPFLLNSKQSLLDFLKAHQRYYTMSSWNRSTSFAHCIKVHQLPLTHEQAQKVYDLISCDSDFYSYFMAPIIEEFQMYMGGKWTMGTNGRSGGWLVLYMNNDRPGTTIGEDLDDMSFAQLQELGKAVKAFDKACDDMLASLIEMANTHEVVERTVTTTRKVRVISEVVSVQEPA